MAQIELDPGQIEKYAKQAAVSGCPRDQTENFIAAGYIAQPIQLLFHAAAREADRMVGPTPEIAVGGSRGPGKSHAVFGQVATDDCQRAPGLKCLFLRKVMKSAAESMEDLTGKVLYGIPYDKTENKISFPNGSRILMGGYYNERDIDKYIGIEYDLIAIEEVTQISSAKRDKIRGSIRTTRDDWKARAYYSTNPDGIGFLWFKTDFVVPAREKTQAATRRFIQAYWYDNKFLKQEYIDYLFSLKGHLGEAWREGNWDAFEGMAFPGWNEEVHKIEPFRIPEWWPKWIGIDWGSSKPFSAHWYTRDPDIGRIYVYREIYQAGLTDRQQARMITQNTPGNEYINTYYCDPSMFARNKSTADEIYSTADEYEKEGIILVAGDNDRLGGKRKVERLFANLQDGKPGIQIFSTCANMIRTLPALPTNPADGANPEDVDTKADDHCYDDMRYALTDYESQIHIEPEPEYDQSNLKLLEDII